MLPGAALLVALFSQGPTGAGGPASEAAATVVRLEVRAAAGCVSRRDLMARIKARSPRIEVADDSAPASALSAEVAVASRRPGEVVAELVWAAAGAEQPPRRVVARSCAEVADAVALIIAVTLDPTLKRQPATAPTPAPAPARDDAADGEAGAAARTESSATPAPTTPPAPPAPPAPPIAVKPVAQPGQGPPAATKRQLGAGISLAGQTIFGPAPTVMPGIALYAMVVLDRDGPWVPALLVGATHVWRSDLSEPGGKASFTLDAASLDACPLRWRWSALAARPCLSALIGRITARGSDTDAAVSSTRPFAAAGAAMTAGVGSTVELSARLGIGLTLIRDSYQLGDAVFHRAAPITISASLGVGTRWP